MATTATAVAAQADTAPAAPVTAPAAPAPETTPSAAPDTPQASARADLYKRIYEPQAAATAPVDTPAPAAPAPSEPATPAAPSLPPEVIQALSELASKLDALDRPEPAAPSAPAAAAPDWIECLKQGNFEEAKKALYQEVASTVGDQIRQQATTESLLQFRLENEMNAFVHDIREKNKDIFLLEDVIGARAEKRIVDARNSGKIKTPHEFLEVYKSAITTEVDHARELYQRIRAAAKAEALTTKSEVVSSSPVPSSTLDPNRQPAQPREPTPLTPGDYIRQRLEKQYRQRGIA